MINFDEFDTEEYKSEDILGFLSREGIRIIKTCSEKNINPVLDVLKLKKIRWVDGGYLSETDVIEYKYLIIHKDNLIRYSNDNPYMSHMYSGYYYYDMCDGNVHKMK